MSSGGRSLQAQTHAQAHAGDLGGGEVLSFAACEGENWVRAEAAKPDSALHKGRYAGFKKISKISFDGLLYRVANTPYRPFL